MWEKKTYPSSRFGDMCHSGWNDRHHGIALFMGQHRSRSD